MHRGCLVFCTQYGYLAFIIIAVGPSSRVAIKRGSVVFCKSLLRWIIVYTDVCLAAVRLVVMYLLTLVVWDCWGTAHCVETCSEWRLWVCVVCGWRLWMCVCVCVCVVWGGSVCALRLSDYCIFRFWLMALWWIVCRQWEKTILVKTMYYTCTYVQVDFPIGKIMSI